MKEFIIFLSLLLLFIPLSAHAIVVDTAYKDDTYSIKSDYYDLENTLKSGIKSAENSLYSANFENADAKKKIDTAWSVRWMAWESHGKIDSALRQTEYSLNNRQYQNSYNNLLQIDQEFYSLKDHLYVIKKEVIDAQNLEKQYQENNRKCILFWCYDFRDTYSGVNSKIQDLELNLNTIESKLSQIKSKQNTITEKIHKFELDDKNTQIKNLENLRKQEQYQADRQERLLQEQIRQEQYEAAQEQKRLEEKRLSDLRQQEYQAEQEKERLREQNRIDESKASIRKQAVNSPLLKGIINGGKLSFWVEPLPADVSSNVRTNVNNLSSYLDGNWFNGVKLTQTNSRSNADFTINWVKDYSPEHIGRQVGDHLLVGLGSSNCKNDWKPFDGITVYQIMYHEVGHALGQDHSNNYNNIMYSPTGDQYEYDYKETITLSDGHWQQIYFCNTGKIYFSTEKAYDSSAGYKVYVLGNNNSPKNVVNGIGDFYPDCSGHKSTWDSFSSPCNVQRGSSLVLYNPSTFGAGADARITIVIENRNDHKDMNYNFESSSKYWSQDQLDAIRELFQNN